MPIRFNGKDERVVFGTHPITNIIKGVSINESLIGYNSMLIIPTIDENYVENVKLNITYINKNKTELINIPVNSPEKKIWIKNKCKIWLTYNQKIYNNQLMEIKLMNGNQEITKNEIIQSSNISILIDIKDIPVPSPNYTYSYNDTNNTCSITGVTNTNIQTANDIESYISYNNKLYTLTSIDNSAFSRCNSLTSIIIPSSITKIGVRVFAWCNNLTSIQVDPTNPVYKSEGNCILTKDRKTLLIGCKNSIIPKSVIYIYNWAFARCGSLTNFVIPEGVISIESDAFESCTNLTNIKIPRSLTNIGGYAFSGCNNLTSIEIPSSVTRIAYGAFSGCSSLTFLCEAPSEPLPWDGWNLDNRPVEWGYNNITTNNEYDYVIHENKVYLTKYKGTNTDINIPNQIKGIDVVNIGSTFSANDLITSIIIPNSITSIGYNTFEFCTSLITVTFTENSQLTSIGADAFSNCKKLTSIEIPSGVTSIGGSAFYNCYSLTGVNITSIEAWCKINFSNGSSNPLDYAHNLYLNKNLVTNLIIPSSITNIGNWIFSSCESLISIEIPNSIIKIGCSAFENCTSLTRINSNIDGEFNIPNSVTSINEKAFQNCSSLTSIVMSEGVTIIGDYAFSSCNSLTSIVIPNSVTSIGAYVFAWCDNLASIQVDPNNNVYKSEGNCMLTKDGKTLLAGCKNSVIPSSVTNISDNAFYRNRGLTSIEIPSSVINIGNSAFSGCSSLTSIVIPSSVINIGNSAFSGCSSLTSIVIPNSVTSIGAYAFTSCNSLTIYCEASSQPSTWDPNWNPDDRPVVWGYKPA